jgi:hypothetical protein
MTHEKSQPKFPPATFPIHTGHGARASCCSDLPATTVGPVSRNGLTHVPGACEMTHDAPEFADMKFVDEGGTSGDVIRGL